MKDYYNDPKYKEFQDIIKQEEQKMKYKLYETDYVIFDTKHGTFDFIINDYPYVYTNECIEEMIWDLCDYGNDYNWNNGFYDNEIENAVFVPTTELPKEIQEKLLNMIIDVYENNT